MPAEKSDCISEKGQPTRKYQNQSRRVDSKVFRPQPHPVILFSLIPSPTRANHHSGTHSRHFISSNPVILHCLLLSHLFPPLPAKRRSTGGSNNKTTPLQLPGTYWQSPCAVAFNSVRLICMSLGYSPQRARQPVSSRGGGAGSSTRFCCAHNRRPHFPPCQPAVVELLPSQAVVQAHLEGSLQHPSASLTSPPPPNPTRGSCDACATIRRHQAPLPIVPAKRLCLVREFPQRLNSQVAQT